MNNTSFPSSFNVGGSLDQQDKTTFGISSSPPGGEVNVDMSLLFVREDILNSLGWELLWPHASIAVQKGYFSSLNASERGRFQLSHYVIGPRFIESMRNNGLHAVSGRIKSVYETCALVICGRAKDLTGVHPRPLRGAGRADRAKPMRADISQEGAGFRLHYWYCSDGTVELSCVNVHNDYNIY